MAPSSVDHLMSSSNLGGHFTSRGSAECCDVTPSWAYVASTAVDGCSGLPATRRNRTEAVDAAGVGGRRDGRVARVVAVGQREGVVYLAVMRLGARHQGHRHHLDILLDRAQTVSPSQPERRRYTRPVAAIWRASVTTAGERRARTTTTGEQRAAQPAGPSTSGMRSGGRTCPWCTGRPLC